MARQVLQISKDENDSNEVAVTYSLESAQLIEKGERYLGIALGAEHDVDPLSDSTFYHLIRTSRVDVEPIKDTNGTLTGLKQSSDADFKARTEKQEEIKSELAAVGIAGNSGGIGMVGSLTSTSSPPRV